MAIRYVDPNADAGGNGTTQALTSGDSSHAFNSLNAWDAARQATISEPEECVCSTNGGAADTIAVFVDGWTTSAANYIEIRTDTAYRHSGIWNAAKYRLAVSTASTTALLVSEDYVRVIGLQISADHLSLGGILQNNLTTGFYCLGNLVRATVATVVSGIQLAGNGGTAHNYVVNNLVYGFSGTGAIGIYCRTATASRAFVYNNTVYGCETGIRPRDSFFFGKNNLTIGNTTSWFAAIVGGSATNAYDQGADPGTGGIDLSGSSDAAIFVDATVQNFHLVSGSPAINVGTDLSADSDYPFSTDINGQTRTGTWDVGADEFVSGGGGGTTLSVNIGEAQLGGSIF